MRGAIGRFVAGENVNFLLTNRIPRRLLTDFVGWFSKIEHPFVARASIAVWRLFSDVDLADAATMRFASMHACFTRRLRPGARPFDPDPATIVSPCDAIVGAQGMIVDGQAYQIKGAPYRLGDLLGDAEEAGRYAGGYYITLRLTAGMYHHFHAPQNLTVEQVTYVSGDCWNVNPIALKRVERLFCKNERAAIRCRLDDGSPIMLVAVAAVLVASIRLNFMDTAKALRDGGPRVIALDAVLAKGDEMGWFEHGSTIVMLLPASHVGLVDTGQRIMAGTALARRIPL